MKPIVNELKEEYEDRVEFRLLDVDQPETEEEIKKYNIRAIPAYEFLDASGEQVDEVVGMMTKDEFRKKIESLLSN